MRRNDPPAALGACRELRLPHPGIEWKGMEENEGAAAPDLGPRRRFQIAKLSYFGHEAIVNVPPPRVESDNPTAIVPAGVETATRSTVVDPRSPINTVPAEIGLCAASAFSFAMSTFTVTVPLTRSKYPESADPLTV